MNLMHPERRRREAAKRASPKPKPIIHYHGRANWQDGLHIVTLSIDGARWEYALLPQQADTVEYLCRKISVRKALAYCRSRSTRQVKL